MKKMILLLAIGILTQFNANSQSQDFAMLCSLYGGVENLEHRNVCTPWASSARLVNIKTNNQVEQNLFRYEKLWLALQETCLKDQRVSNRMVITLNKKGKIESIFQNGRAVELASFPTLSKKRFKNLRSSNGLNVKIYTRIG